MANLGVEAFLEENRSLKEELDRMTNLFSSCQAEKDEIGQKYQLLSERMEALIELQVNDAENEELFEVLRSRQGTAWRNELLEELTACRKRLKEFQEQQSKQAHIIIDLQKKVDNYQSKCASLEKSLIEESERTVQVAGDSSPAHRMNVNYETMLVKLEEEEKRSQTLTEVNGMLREQLESATHANQALTSDIHHLTQEWQQTRRELDVKEREWREEEQSFNDYFTKEHHRLLALWHHLLRFRHDFYNMKSAAERELMGMKTYLRQASNGVSSACLTFVSSGPLQISDPISWELQHKSAELVNVRLKFNAEREEMLEKIRELNMQIEKRSSLMDEKEKVVTALNKTVNALESSKSVTIAQDNRATAMMREEVEHLYNVLRDIRQAIVDDSDHLGTHHHLLSRGLNRRARSVPPGTEFTSHSNLAESTLSAVCSVLKKRRLNVEEMENRIRDCQEQLKVQERKLEESEEEKVRIRRQHTQVSSRLELLQQEVQNTVRDAGRMKSALDESGSERHLLEHTRHLLNEQVDSLNSENDRLYKKQREMQQNMEKLQDEVEELRFREKRLLEDAKRCAVQIKSLNEKETKCKDEIKSLNDSISRLTIEKELVTHEKTNFASRVSEIDQARKLIEAELDALKEEERSLSNTIHNLQHKNEMVLQDKNDALLSLAQLKDVKALSDKEKLELEEDKRKLALEVSSLHGEMKSKTDKIKSLQGSLEESERAFNEQKRTISSVIREKEAIQSQLVLANQQKENKNDELQRTVKETRKKDERLQQLELEKGELFKEKSELEMKVHALEEEEETLSETVAVLRSEKERLEVALYSNQQTLSSMEYKKDELEREVDDLKCHKESLQAQLEDLRKLKEMDAQVFSQSKEMFTKKLRELEEECQKNLHQEIERCRIEVESVRQEKVSQVSKITSELEETKEAHQKEQEQVMKKHVQEMEALRRELASLHKEWENRFTSAETEREKLEELSKKERNVLETKLQEAESYVKEVEKQMEEMKTHIDELTTREHSMLEDHHAQITALKSKLQNAIATSEKELKDVSNKLTEIQQQKDEFSEMNTKMKIQMRSLEENRDDLKSKILEANRKVKELEFQQTNLQKLLQGFEQKVHEDRDIKDTLEKANRDLKETLRLTEGNMQEAQQSGDKLRNKQNSLQANNDSLSKECTNLKKTLKEVEESRQEMKRELLSYQKQIAALKADIGSRRDEIESQKLLRSQTEKRELELHKEMADAKQELLQTEAARETLRKELVNLQFKLVDAEHQLQMQQENHQALLQESQASENRYEKRSADLEVSLSQNEQDNQKLRLSLKSVEGQVTALESKLNKSDASKNEMENRLANIQAVLRYTLGLGLDTSLASSPTTGFWSQADSPPGTKETVVTPSSRRSKSPSPSRQNISWTTLDLDAELVRCALQDLVQKVSSSDKEKEEWKRQSQRSQRQVEELTEDNSSSRTQINQLQKQIFDIGNDKHNLEIQLSSVRANLLHSEELVQRLEREKKNSQEKIISLENSVAASEMAKTFLQEKVDTLKEAEIQWERFQIGFQQSKEESEAQITKVELKNQALEGDVQRLQLILNDKESDNKVYQQRLQSVKQKLETIEDKNSSLQQTVDRLTISLQQTVQSEQEFKERFTSANRSFNESSNVTHNLQQQIRNARQELLNSEQEKNVLHKALAEAKSSLMESQNRNKLLQDRLHHLEEELGQSESRIGEIESQMKTTSSTIAHQQEVERGVFHQLTQAEKEKMNLHSQIIDLQQQFTELKTTKEQLEHSNSRLQKEHSNLQKSFERVDKERHKMELSSYSLVERSELQKAMSLLEAENVELQRKVQALQVKLAEVNEQHLQRLIELKGARQQDVHTEMERLHVSQRQAEQLLELREKTHRQRILGLQQQIATLKEQLEFEQRRWNQYHHSSGEIGYLHSVLDRSLRTVSNDPNQMESEALKLDSAIENQMRRSPAKLTTPSKLSKNLRVPFQSTPSKSPHLRKRLDAAFTK